MGQVRHGRARRQSCNTTIASFARDAEPGAGDQSQDRRKLAEASDGRGSQDRAEEAALHRLVGG